MTRLGIRVVRGPDWSYGDQDGGEGHVGTVVEIPGENNSALPEKCVAVRWDGGAGGEKHQYKAGADDTYDLLVFNNARNGASHKVLCDWCEENNFEGLRWKCNRCGEYNLCNSCYMSDKHDVNHDFTIFDTRGSDGETVPARSKSQEQRVKSIGMFTGATVGRGPDWIWGDQFGDDDVQGEVIEVKNNRIAVKWPTQSIIFNLVEDGRHLLKCVNPVCGIDYYKSHLPILGKSEVESRDGFVNFMELLMSPLLEIMEMASASTTMYGIRKGYRVIRGPDWRWEDQDGGEGHVGTVVKCEPKEKDVHVLWDSGECRNYRAGNGGAYDLRLLDNAPGGVKHTCIGCNECHEAPLFGIRWKCSVCEDYDLCSTCYMSDKHDLSHSFLRIDKEFTARPIPVPARSDSQTIPVMGIFPGASVKPGKDWKWEEMDGESVGEVVQIKKWTPETRRSRADVKWPGITDRPVAYRLGHKGKVDLKCVKEAPGGHCYKEHLPVLGKKEAVAPKFKAGDKVNIILPKGLVVKMQEDYGGWTENIEGYMKKVGSVIKINDYGVVTVKYDDGTKFVYNQDVLNQVWLNPDSLNGIPEPVPASNTEEAGEEQKARQSTEDTNDLDKDDSKKGTQQPLCKICLTRDACVAFVPCGHLVSCPECAEGLDKCPICRSEIRQWLRTFIQ